MKTFDHIAIIFNPNSTGDAPQIASQLAESINRSHKTIGVEATPTPTEHAGHASELAEAISLKYKRPLIISVSGDGGYNEVVNGVMRAKNKRSRVRPVVAISAAGNANDHRRVMRSDTSLVELIRRGNVKPLDVLELKASASGFRLKRYAHSYVGFGVTPEVGVELNKHKLNFFQEIRLLVKAFWRFKPFSVEYEGVKREVGSLVFANINEMAKVLKLDETNDVRDSKFEVIEFSYRHKLGLLVDFLRAATLGIKHPPSYSEYSFKTFDSHPVQCDGEIEQLPRRSTVTISCIGHAIDSLY